MKYLTPSEYAQLMRVDLRTVYSWLRSNQVPGAFKMGGVWRIPKPQK